MLSFEVFNISSHSVSHYMHATYTAESSYGLMWYRQTYTRKQRKKQAKKYFPTRRIEAKQSANVLSMIPGLL